MKNLHKGFALVSVIAFIAVLAIVAIGGGIYYSQNYSSSVTAPGSTVTSVATPDVIDLSANKNGHIVNVIITKNAAPYKTFSYEEYFPYEPNSGNSWTRLPASISLSPDSKFVAYSSKDALQIMELSTNKVTVLRTHTETVRPAAHLLWSPDSRYIAYRQIGLGGSNVGIADIQTKTYKDTIIRGGPKTLTWSQNNQKLNLTYSSDFESEYDPEKGVYTAEINSINNIDFVRIR